jgi:large subunit ribosomal protein L9
MEIILLENILNLGKLGEVVKVKSGFGRNFLLPKKKALRATKENIEFVNSKKVDLQKKENEQKKIFLDLAKKIQSKTIAFSKQSKENGDLYASIKPKEISSSILEQLKVGINPSQIILKDDLNKIGNFNINIFFHSDVSALLNIKIKKIDSK